MAKPTQLEIELEWYRSSVQITRDLGSLAIKTLITLNSGAFVVLLTFLGNAAAQTAFFVSIEAIKIAMLCFLGGITAAFLVLSLGYTVALLADPYAGSSRLNGWAVIPAYLLISAISLGLFIFGVWTIVSGVQTQ